VRTIRTYKGVSRELCFSLEAASFPRCWALVPLQAAFLMRHAGPFVGGLLNKAAADWQPTRLRTSCAVTGQFRRQRVREKNQSGGGGAFLFLGGLVFFGGGGGGEGGGGGGFSHRGTCLYTVDQGTVSAGRSITCRGNCRMQNAEVASIPCRKSRQLKSLYETLTSFPRNGSAGWWQEKNWLGI